MKIILLLISLILIFRFIIDSHRLSIYQKQRLEAVFCWVSYLMIVLLAMFRTSKVGADTASYMADYELVKLMTFDEIALEYDRYIAYYSLSKVFTLFELPCYIWFGFIELMLVTSLSRLFNRYSKDHLYSIVLFLTTGLFMFSLAGLKQTLGLALMVHAFIFFVDRRYLMAALLVILAFFSHPVSLITLVAFTLYQFRNSKLVMPVVALLSAFICFSELTTVSHLVSMLGYDHYEMYLELNRSYTKSTLVLYILIMACTIPFLKRYIRINSLSKFELGSAIFTCTFQFLASFSPSLFRLAFAFVPFFFLYVPNSFYASKSIRMSSILKLCAILGPIAFFVYSNRNFNFSFISF